MTTSFVEGEYRRRRSWWVSILSTLFVEGDVFNEEAITAPMNDRFAV